MSERREHRAVVFVADVRREVFVFVYLLRQVQWVDGVRHYGIGFWLRFQYRQAWVALSVWFGNKKTTVKYGAREVSLCSINVLVEGCKLFFHEIFHGCANLMCKR